MVSYHAGSHLHAIAQDLYGGKDVGEQQPGFEDDSGNTR